MRVRFQTALVHGGKVPYTTWTFVVLPPDVLASLGGKTPVDVPDELRRVLDADPDVHTRFDALPPSLRRAWAAYVAEAKKAETRTRRAAKAPAGIRTRSFPR